jgi:dienelactone hydrolase
MCRPGFQFHVFSFQLVALFAGIATAQEIRVLPPDFNADKENQMMRSHLRQRVHAALDAREARLEKLEKAEQIAAYQTSLRDFFRESIDLDSFKKSPLNAQVTGRLEREGYSVEKVIYESLPGFHITANLYLPAGKGPHPAVLHPCGHTDIGKAYGEYQRANILLARHGIAVLCYDPIGQGERRLLRDPETGKTLASASGEHQILGVPPIALGRGLASHMIWDGMRGLDYLQSRADIDSSRLGSMGNSGGGNLTAMLMALDERVTAAAPGCFMTTTRMKNESPGPGDAEQNLFGQIHAGLDHPDFAILRAPRPTLILAATADFVPIEGTWDAFRQAKRVYTKLGFPERVDLVEAPEKHGFTRQLRESAARFFAHWLRGEIVEIVETPEVTVEAPADLQCTLQGSVLALPKERHLFDLNRERAAELAAARRPIWEMASNDERRALVRKAIGFREMNYAVTPVGKDTLVITPESGITLPAVVEKGTGAGSHLLLPDGGLNARQLPASFGDTLTVDLRDLGETKTKNWRFYGADWWIAYMLGDSYLAMRTADIVSIAKHWKPGEPLHLHAWGETVPAALHAAAIEPGLFDSVTLHGGLTSWESLLDSRDPIPHLHNQVHGALRHYDLPDLIPLIGKEKLTITE